MSARAVREEHADLQKELETVQLSVEAAKADVATAQRELRTLRDKVGWLLQAPNQVLVPMQKFPHSKQGFGSDVGILAIKVSAPPTPPPPPTP